MSGGEQLYIMMTDNICNDEYFETSVISTSYETFNSAHLRPQFDRFGEPNSKVIPGKEPRGA